VGKRSVSDESLEYLDTHAQNIYLTYEIIFDETDDANRKLSIKERMNDLCGLIILTLRKFPHSEKYIVKWGSKITFKHSIENGKINLISYTNTVQ
jgi:hypothetical protein